MNDNIHALEARIKNAKREELHILQQALRDRQRQIKLLAMEFEQTNSRHFLVFDSTENFYKSAGRSVLFYAYTIADRIHRRYNIKFDSDNYAQSEDGIVSFRSLKKLEAELATIGILPDPKLSTDELHFYLLPKSYTDEQVAEFRDLSKRDAERIAAIILPTTPVPELYSLLSELNRKIYYNSKRIADPLARETLLRGLLLDAHQCLMDYLAFANAATSQNEMLDILLNIRRIRHTMANMENLRLFHRKDICEILELVARIERLARRLHQRQQGKNEQ